jgi:hypothetical protein
LNSKFLTANLKAAQVSSLTSEGTFPTEKKAVLTLHFHFEQATVNLSFISYLLIPKLHCRAFFFFPKS